MNLNSISIRIQKKKIVPESLMWLQMISEGTNVSLLDDNKT